MKITAIAPAIPIPSNRSDWEPRSRKGFPDEVSLMRKRMRMNPVTPTPKPATSSVTNSLTPSSNLPSKPSCSLVRIAGGMTLSTQSWTFEASGNTGGAAFCTRNRIEFPKRQMGGLPDAIDWALSLLTANPDPCMTFQAPNGRKEVKAPRTRHARNAPFFCLSKGH